MGGVACVLVQDFPLAARVRSDPELRDKPLALSRAPGMRAELEFVSPLARQAGVRSGMTAAQASAILPGLAVMPYSQAAELSAAAALMDAAESFSPVVEEGGPGRVYLDLGGLGAIHGSEDEMAAELMRRVGRVGLEAAVGIAANKEVAWLAARCGGARVIEPGREREFLNWLPLDLLAADRAANHAQPPGAVGEVIDEELQLTLARWGIRRLGDLARLKGREVGSRLGSAGVELVRMARGENHAPVVARPRPELFVERVELDYGLELLEALGFVMRAMLDRLIARLKLRGLVAGDVLLALDLTGHRRDQRRLAIAAASNEARSILTLINLSLAGAPPPAAVEAVEISIEPRQPRPSQSDLFLPPAPAPARLEATLARLAALCGPDRVGVLTPENSHRPEAVARRDFAPLPPPPAPPGGGNGSNVSRIVVRAIRPAREVEVMCERGLPSFVRGELIAARVVSLAGPWRRQGEWWNAENSPSPQPSPGSGRGSLGGLSSGGGGVDASPGSGRGRRAFSSPGEGFWPERGNQESSCTSTPAPLARDYYEMALADGGVYRVYYDLDAARWYVDGVYD